MRNVVIVDDGTGPSVHDVTEIDGLIRSLDDFSHGRGERPSWHLSMHMFEGLDDFEKKYAFSALLSFAVTTADVLSHVYDDAELLIDIAKMKKLGVWSSGAAGKPERVEGDDV